MSDGYDYTEKDVTSAYFQGETRGYCNGETCGYDRGCAESRDVGFDAGYLCAMEEFKLELLDMLKRLHI